MATNGVERGVERPKRADSIIDEHSQSPDKEHDVAVTSYVRSSSWLMA
jgi:hypothetical protein